MNPSLVIRLWLRLLHLSFLINIHRKTLSPKYWLMAAIPSSISKWAFFPSANTICHQIKTLLPGGNQLPVCNLLSHVCHYSAMIIHLLLCFLFAPYPPNSESPHSSLYGFLSQTIKFNVCIIGASFNFPLVVYQISTLFPPIQPLTPLMFSLGSLGTT